MEDDFVALLHDRHQEATELADLAHQKNRHRAVGVDPVKHGDEGFPLLFAH